jgi:hypothetical protein
MIDRFLVDLGLIKSEEETFEEKAKVAMVSGAEGFLRAGGQLSWDLWVSLGGESRDAFIIANEKLVHERIALGAMANENINFALEMMTQSDGGLMKAHYVMNAILDHAENRLRKQRPLELKAELPR